MNISWVMMLSVLGGGREETTKMRSRVDPNP
jgi:hypothetical protein